MKVNKTPATVSIPHAGGLIGIGRNKAYEMARNGTFPVRVLKIGARYRVPTADLDRFLGIERPERAGASA